jgi:hypothetical protein
MVVVVTCKKCGQEFPSKLVQTINEEGLKSFKFQTNNEICQSCGQSSGYSVNDYLLETVKTQDYFRNGLRHSV